MKLVVLYGAPASGKLTIANELAAISDCKVFHNHLVIDVVEPIVTRKYSKFAELIYSIQRSVIAAAIAAGQNNVVMTFPYAANLQRDKDFIAGITNYGRTHGAEVYPIFVHCSEATLRRRATDDSRKAYGKITTVETMNTMIAKYDFHTPLAIEGGAMIDSDKLSAKAAAERIRILADL